eukprot:1367453-Amorphochlora_amoeboformis.AAC.2
MSERTAVRPAVSPAVNPAAVDETPDRSCRLGGISQQLLECLYFLDEYECAGWLARCARKIVVFPARTCIRSRSSKLGPANRARCWAKNWAAWSKRSKAVTGVTGHRRSLFRG